MLFSSQEKLSCDVLIIGGGGAGLRAAIAAKMHDTDVLLVSKTKVGPNSNTYISKSVIATAGWGTPGDDEDAYIADTVRGGRFLNDQSLVAKVAERSHSEIAFLENCGVNFEMHAGRPRMIRVAGHRHPRHIYGTNWSGRDLVVPLLHRARQVGVRFAEKVFVTRLLKNENRICGATGIHADGRFFTIHAKVVVLATGGYGQIYLNTNNVPGITGDGLALAYEVGVALKDMEFVQFYPTAAGRRGSRLVRYESLLAQPGVTLLNGRGANILEQHHIDDLTKVTRDRLAQVIANEIRQGDLSDNGIWMNLEALSEAAARQLSSILPSKWWKGQKRFKVVPTAHFAMGGIVTDGFGETSLKGLFAVGEAAAGVHGANRLGGNALAEIFAMGSLVGDMAAKSTLELETIPSAKIASDEERSRLAKAHANTGLRAAQLIGELKQLMWEKVGVIRHEKGLIEAIEHLQRPEPHVAVSSPAHLVKFLELQNMRRVAKMVCKAAIARTESRGSHFRRDYPKEDNRIWLKNIVIRKSSEGIDLEPKPVNLDLVNSDNH